MQDLGTIMVTLVGGYQMIELLSHAPWLQMIEFLYYLGVDLVGKT